MDAAGALPSAERASARAYAAAPLLPTGSEVFHELLDLRTRQSHRGEILRGVRLEPGNGLQQLRHPTITSR
jgi:hypothetical protein